MKSTIRQDDRSETGVMAGGDRWVAGLEEAIDAALRALRRNPSGSPAIHQVRVAVPYMDPLDWLRAQPETQRLFWCGRDESDARAAVGIALDVRLGEGDPYQVIRRTLTPLLRDADPGVRFFGGMRFDLDRDAAAEWEGFGAGRFVLPRFVLEPAEAGSTLVCNLVVPADLDQPAAICQQAARLAEPLASQYALPVPIARQDVPVHDAWAATIDRAIQRFASGALEKVVLARRSRFTFAERLDATLLLQRLQAATPHCFHFLFQFDADAQFLGASPERLYQREGRRIRSEAVAGTRPRGASQERDAELKRELLHSDKDRREQAFVRDNIEEALRALCVDVRVDDEPRLMELAKGRHLCTLIEGSLADSAGDADILERLHPTPAVGGVPLGEAMQDIRAGEEFDRGWYAGPVGWIGRDRAEFAVGIRSGQVSPRALTLYAGAGIVRGSEAEKEWAEIEHKISDFLTVLGLDLRDVKY